MLQNLGVVIQQVSCDKAEQNRWKSNSNKLIVACGLLLEGKLDYPRWWVLRSAQFHFFPFLPISQAN